MEFIKSISNYEINIKFLKTMKYYSCYKSAGIDFVESSGDFQIFQILANFHSF